MNSVELILMKIGFDYAYFYPFSWNKSSGNDYNSIAVGIVNNEQ